MGARKWTMQYGVAMAMAFVLALVLGQIPLFRETGVGKLRASDLVQFLGYGGSLVIAWLGARDIARNPPGEWKWIKPFQGIIVPLVTLSVVGMAYGVLLFVLAPFLSKAGHAIYNWGFITAIVSNGIWLIICWVWKCAPMVAATETPKIRKVA
jgi:hypothetical protein